MLGGVNRRSTVGGGALVSEGVLQIYELDADVYERSA